MFSAHKENNQHTISMKTDEVTPGRRKANDWKMKNSFLPNQGPSRETHNSNPLSHDDSWSSPYKTSSLQAIEEFGLLSISFPILLGGAIHNKIAYLSPL